MKRVKAGYVFALAAAVFLTGLGILKTQAASAIDTGRECSLTISVDVGGGVGDDNQKYLEDFSQIEIPVSVYKVANVDTTGQKFTPVSPFEKMNFNSIGKAGEDASADEWQRLGAQAAEIQQKNECKETGKTTITPTQGSAAAQGKMEGLGTGLYLVVPEAVSNKDYTVQYTFTPYLTALPSSSYALDGAGSDEWVYDTTIGLKPEAAPLYGKLNIIKNLQNYNATLGRTTFVFSIVGVDRETGETKYEEVESVSFTAPGSQTIALEGIPAGLEVTVTEIYSGASYRVEGDGEAVTLICSEEGVALGGQKEASVTFTNSYDGGNRGGYGVTNHFEADGQEGWIWHNPTNPAVPEEE